MGRGGYWGDLRFLGALVLHIFTRKDAKLTLVPGVFLRPASALKKLHISHSRCVVCPQGLCKALQELRAEMVATAERNVIANAAQKEESLNVQILVDKQTKDLKARSPNHHHSCVH